MTPVEIIAHFLGQMGLWMNDNLGNGDGTQYIQEIWKRDPDMADHLAAKWRGYLEQAKEDTGMDSAMDYNIQWIAFIHFLNGLSQANTELLVKYIAENGRSK